MGRTHQHRGSGVAGTGAPLPPPSMDPGKPLVQILRPFTTLLGLDQQPCELVVAHGPDDSPDVSEGKGAAPF